jgi:hypothetical protein
MGQYISIGEFIIISVVCLLGYVLVKTIFETIKNK